MIDGKDVIVTMQGATTFSAAMASKPVRAFQWITLAVCMLALVSDGMDMQLLGIVAPLIIADFGVDRGTFGVAMSAALIGFGLGAWGGGWTGDRLGRRYTLVLATLIFAVATMVVSRADGVWAMAFWRIIAGIGFGATYANALAMAGEWMPERWRAVTVSTLSVGTPIGGTVVGWLGPSLSELYGWRGTFLLFGIATLLLVLIVFTLLRDSPSFLMARGRTQEAARAARRVLHDDVQLVAERRPGAEDGHVGVLHRANLRLNVGIGIAFTAFALVAYGILNWSTTFLTAAGFTLQQAGYAVSVAGITSIAGSIAAGAFANRFGSRRIITVMSTTLLALLIALAFVIENLPAVPDASQRLLVISLIGAAAALFSGGIATMYVIMTFGYPPSCRSAGLGFGIFMSRVGAISASGLGGALLDLGQGSVVPFFAVLALGTILVLVAAYIIDPHIPPARLAARPALA